MTKLQADDTGYSGKGFLRSLLISIFAFTPMVLIAACTTSKPPVYIPPEYRSPPAQTPLPQAPASPSAQQPAPPQGPVINRPSEFKKQDLPATPPVQPQSQPQPPTAPQVGQGLREPPKKQEAQSPQLLASMQLVNEARGPLERGKPDVAIPVLERAIQVDVENAEAFMLLARAWRQKGAKQKALEFAKKAEILYQDEPARLKKVYQLEADLYKEMGNNSKASQYRRKAAELR
ncbi:MAG: tetratricopeptide repeat protein [Syntrophobacteraceae bacterium]